MVFWNNKQTAIIDTFRETGVVPTASMKCPTCRILVSKEHLVEGTCPTCGNANLEEACPLDHCNCTHGNHAKIEFCPICGKTVCPTCGSHDVVAVSRVTGYYADVMGWNESKRQELKDRTRVEV